MKTYNVNFVNTKTGKIVSDFNIKAASLKEAKRDAQLHKEPEFKGLKTVVKAIL